MNIKIHSSELNRMMKTLSQCVNEKLERFSNVEICYDNNAITIRATDGQLAAVMSTPLLGGDGETFCVDGTTFAKVCGMSNGDVIITTTDKDCYIKGNGRTRIPIVNAELPKYKSLDKNNPTVLVKAEDLRKAYGCVAHAISGDQSRIQLTGILTEVDDTGLRMTTLDGFRMAIETIDCDGDPMKIVIPGSFMQLVQGSVAAGETVSIVTDGKRIEVSTEGMRITSGLLSGEFPDINRILPSEFKTESLVGSDALRSALKGSNTLNSKENLVKMQIGKNSMDVMSNSEKADYEAEIACTTNGDGLKVAFNLRYLMDTIASIGSESIVMKFNTMYTPCIVQGKDENGIRLILPVRTQG